ncbi:MAG: Cytochrome c bioproteinis protein [Candidatus Peregrinibacteria bacterium Greene0416_19]|nr:MAG: Cytochrome c bioproteinis protein [Candidatus Peregrinibacteria bacterium Greene0416_19]
MMSTFGLVVTLFGAGLLTILLPCILPLIPIVLGVSIAGRSRLRPLLTIAGMLVSFVGFTFLLLVVLNQFVALADYIRIATFYALVLFGLGFLTHDRAAQYAGAVLGAFFFWGKGLESVIIAAVLGVLAMEIGGRIATRIQQWGTDIQQSATQALGRENPLAAFIIGLTLGLVWVPCAGPALGFAFALVRDEPGVRAALLLGAYGLGTAVPLLLIGYGGQAAVHSVRALSRFTGIVKQVAGVLLIVTAVSLQYRFFEKFQVWLLDHTNFGDLGTRLEERLFGDQFGNEPRVENPPSGNNFSSASMNLPKLPKLVRAPEFTGLGPWHNSEPFTLASLKGKVVLVDFWTYSCINCIRTLPYMEGYWDKFKDTGRFVLIGVHSPEFVFEKDQGNVRDAIKRHGLTYPVAQDNDFGTWRAFANRYWPAKYLIDAEGTIRYTHFGEGAYEETDLAIQSLLQEIGITITTDSAGIPPALSTRGSEERRDQTPEIYLGERSWPSLGNAQFEPSDIVVDYVAPASMQLHKYYLVGKWQLMDGERQVLRSDEGEIRMKFLGSEINLVMGLDDGAKPGSAEVFIDGEKVTSLTLDGDKLFTLFKGEYGEHEIVLKIRGKGVEGYAFTFGG